MATLAVDVGMTNYGMAVFRGDRLVDWCAVITKPDKTLSRTEDYVARGHKIIAALERIYSKHKPLHLVAEMPSRGSQSAVATHAMGYSSGLTTAWAGTRNIPMATMQARKCYSLFHGVKKGVRVPTKERKERTMQRVLKLYPQLRKIKTKKELETISDAIQCRVAWSKEK